VHKPDAGVRWSLWGISRTILFWKDCDLFSRCYSGNTPASQPVWKTWMN